MVYLQREWDRGRILLALTPEAATFPLKVPLKVPSSHELSEHFVQVQEWIGDLKAWLNSAGKPGCRLETRSLNHRIIGQNNLPHQVWVDTPEIAARLLKKETALEQFQWVYSLTRTLVPALLPWLHRRPLRAAELAPEWPRLLDLVSWYLAHPRPGIYVRQIDLPGIHTKFVEVNQGVLTELLDLVLPPTETRPSVLSFESRFGFTQKPPRIRFRLLDEGSRWPPGLSDITLTAAEFGHFDPGFRRVFITENEISFLSFPALPDTLVIFGAGYGFDMLRDVPWLQDATVTYWGDIDTHGFAILDQLRRILPQVQSLLMDENTLLHYHTMWSEEKTPTRRVLAHLHPGESSVYEGLCQNRWGQMIRLEQERIPFSHVQRVLADY